jgi:signal transduction histidine kinase/ligand-binding sensor domain-containing protein
MKSCKGYSTFGYKLVFLLLLQISVPLIAQSVGLNFKYLTTRDGLSDDGVLCIYQDKDGFIWFGTESGIDRYDGRSFQPFYDLVKDTTNVFLQRTSAICEDSYDGIWFSNDTNGLVLLNKKKLKSTRFQHKPGDEKSLASNHVRNIFEDSRKNLWIATLGGGLGLFNRKDSTFINYKFDSLSIKGIGSNFITSIAEDRTGMLWLSSPEGLLIKLDPVTKEFENIRVYQGFPFLFGNVNSPLIYIDSADNIWYLVPQGLYRYNKSDRSLKYTALTLDGVNMTFTMLTSMMELPKSKYLITTLSRGLFEFDAVSGKFTNYSYNPASPFGINSNRLTCIFKSREGTIWLGTSDNGVNIYSKNAIRFPSLVNLVQTHYLNLSSFSTYTICEMPDQRIWMGTNVGGIIEYDPQKGSLQKILTELSDISIFNLSRDKENNIWIGAICEGLYYYDWKLKKLKHLNSFPNNPDLKIGMDVVRIVEDRKGRLWLGYMRDGIAVFDKTTNTFLRFRNNPSDKHSISNNLIYKIFEDSRGRIWVGTGDGLNLFNPRNNSFIRIPFRGANGKDEFGISVFDISEDYKNQLWIGTEQNLYLYDANISSCTSYLPDNADKTIAVCRIIESYNHFLWLGTNNGIYRFDPETRLLQDYGRSDGIRYLSFNPASGVLSKDGFIYLGSAKGVTIFNPAEISEDQYIPPVYITGLSVNDIAVAVDMDDPLIDKPIEYINRIRLNYKQSTLSFQFAALNYNNPENNQYSYILQGFDKVWNKPGIANTAHYANLPPGKYIFKVTASNNHGLWNTSGKELEIIIKPPVWRTWWFRILALFSISSLILFILYNRFYRLQRQKAMLEGIVNERTSELNSANNALTEQHEELIQQHEEISTQNELLSQMSDEILKQNAELEHHRSNLEKLVDERTKELGIAIHKAEESDKLKSAFLANMSHEIRTPMNAIVGFANLLKDDAIDPEERHEYIDVINANSEVLLVLIDDILDLSLIEADQLNIKKEVFGLNEIMDHLYSSFSLMNRKDNLVIKLNNELHNQNLKIYSDRIRINQILSNLLNNAYKFTDKGYIELGLKKENDRLIMYVRDTGIGIKESDLDKIFERFRKSEAKSNTLYRGTGLGLAISKALARLLGGNLTAESAVGQGSVFYFNMPYSIITQKETVIKQPTIHKDIQKWTDKNILVVEDEKANYLYVEKMLGRMDVHVHWAENGLEAVKLVSSEIHYDLILMDIKMPVMDGFEATKIIKKKSPGQVVIALTAYARPEDRLHFMTAGFDDYLSKPIRPNDFMGVIRRYI